MKHIVFIFFISISFAALAQQKQITLEDLYKKGTFRGENIYPDFGKKNDSVNINTKELTLKNGKSIGEPDDVIVFEKNASLAIIKVQTEPIYRHSSKSIVYFYNKNSKKLIQLADDKILHPEFSPDGTKIAYVKNNNLYLYDISLNKTKAITNDGKWNYIINGNCDWVYEEEFEFAKAYQWSPKGNYIAYYRFDETNVKEYTFTEFDNNYNHQYSYKYPKAGEDNSKIEIHIYNVNTGKNTSAGFEQGDIYIPRIKWGTLDNQLIVYWLNRHQNDLKLLLTDPDSGKYNLMYEEKNKYYVEINDDWRFLKDANHFIFTSEMNGYKNLYRYSIDGKQKTAITHSKYDIDEISKIDEVNSLVYYTAAYPRPMDRTLFVTDFEGKKTYQLTTDTGFHHIIFNDAGTQFYDYYSTINTPQKVTLNNISNNNNQIVATVDKSLGDNNKLMALLKDYNLGKVEFIKFTNDNGDEINGWMLKPAHFDSSKKYPVLFCNYGGPGSQQVVNHYGATSMWHQLLAQKGFIIVSFDNTGTGFRGEAFKKKTYLQLGKYEIQDQIDAAKWLSHFSYIDKNHIGHWGWSFGGFMSSLAITKGSDVFAAAIAVAPVTNWRYYDNIYTERYMHTPNENAQGYDNNSPINFTNKIKGKYLLIHGTADDNVHFQNSTQMVTALIKNDIPFESAYYPNKNHSISGYSDNTTLHLWTKMTNWILQNLGNEVTDKTMLK